MEITSGIHQLKVPIPDNPLEHVNCYLIEGTEGWFMIDPGWYTPDTLRFLEEGLKDIGLGLMDIHTMMVTHIHADHYGLAGRIQQKSPKSHLLIHRHESDLLDSRYMRFSDLLDAMGIFMERHGAPPENTQALVSASMPAIEFVMMTHPDRVLYGGETISTGIYDLEVIMTPGHSPGHICLYEPKNQILFSGDHILPTISSNISYHVQSGDNPLGDYLSSLRKLEHLPVAKVLPAHENTFTDLHGRILDLFTHHESRLSEIMSTISEKPRNAYDISSGLTWNTMGASWDDLPSLHQRVAVSETIAHLEYQRWEGKVKRITEDNLISYVMQPTHSHVSI